MIVDLGALGVEEAAYPNRMLIEAVVGRIDLDTVCKIAAENLRRGAVVDQVARVIGIERDGGIAAERCDLIVDVRPDRSLERKHAEVVLLELVLGNVARRIDRDARERVHLRLIGVGGNPEVIDRGSGDETEPGRRV